MIIYRQFLDDGDMDDKKISNKACERGYRCP